MAEFNYKNLILDVAATSLETFDGETHTRVTNYLKEEDWHNLCLLFEGAVKRYENKSFFEIRPGNYYAYKKHKQRYSEIVTLLLSI